MWSVRRIIQQDQDHRKVTVKGDRSTTITLMGAASVSLFILFICSDWRIKCNHVDGGLEHRHEELNIIAPHSVQAFTILYI